MTRKTRIQSVRFTPEQWKQIERKAAAANLPPSTFIRRAVLGRQILHRTTPEAIQALNRIGVNVNQLARVANTTGRVPPELRAVLEQVEAAVDQLLDR